MIPCILHQKCYVPFNCCIQYSPMFKLSHSKVNQDAEWQCGGMLLQAAAIEVDSKGDTQGMTPITRHCAVLHEIPIMVCSIKNGDFKILILDHRVSQWKSLMVRNYMQLCVRTGATSFGTIRTEIGMQVPSSVWTNMFATARLLHGETWALNDETEMISTPDGWSWSSFANCCVTNDRCVPSSIKMRPSVVVVYEDASAIAVFNKQTLVCRALRGQNPKWQGLMFVLLLIVGWLAGVEDWPLETYCQQENTGKGYSDGTSYTLYKWTLTYTGMLCVVVDN